jgi:hypothetical protein
MDAAGRECARSLWILTGNPYIHRPIVYDTGIDVFRGQHHHEIFTTLSANGLFPQREPNGQGICRRASELL